jgi:hypothetical protein
VDKVSIYLQNIINVLPWKHLQVAEAYTVLKVKLAQNLSALLFTLIKLWTRLVSTEISFMYFHGCLSSCDHKVVRYTCMYVCMCLPIGAYHN